MALKNIGLTPGIPKGCFQNPQDIVIISNREGLIHDFFRSNFVLRTQSFRNAQANRFDQNEKEGTFINLYLLTFEKKVDANLRKFVIEEWLAVSSS